MGEVSRLHGGSVLRRYFTWGESLVYMGEASLALEKTCKINEKIMKNGREFARRKKEPKKALKNQIRERLGLHLGGFGGGFGRDLEALGVSWVVFGAIF